MGLQIIRCWAELRQGWRIDRNSIRRSHGQKWSHVVLLGLVVCVLSSCQLTPYIRHVHEDDHLLVRLEDHTGGPFPENPTQFDHPIKLSEDQWGRMLRMIQIQREPGGDPAYRLANATKRSGKTPDLLFNEQEVLLLQKYVAQAFTQARSSEWVTFVVRHPLGSYRWLNKSIIAQSISSGGFFVADNALHGYLANIRAPVTLTTIAEHILANPFYVTDATFYQVENTTMQTVKKRPQKGLQGEINPSIYEVTLDMPRIFETQEGERQSQPTEDEFSSASSTHETEVAKKMRHLLKLQQEGLITDEDYSVMKRKLLDQFIDEFPRVRGIDNN